MAADGRAYAVWEDRLNLQSPLFVVGAEYDPTTVNWSAQMQISYAPTSAYADYPTVAFDGSRVAVAWRDKRLDSNGDIFTRQRD